MKIVVLVKEVPDTYGNRKLNLETGLADREASDAVLDEIGERALEVALSYADAHEGTEVVALSMCAETSTATVRKALAMGAHRAIHIADEQLLGADLTLTAEVLAGALTREKFDLIIAGNASTDGSGGMIPAMVAEHLGLPSATELSAVELTEQSLRGTRAAGWGSQDISVDLPAVISITEALPDARFANFKGVMAAKKKPLDVVTLNDLGIDTDPTRTPRSILTAVNERPPRSAGVKIVDEGDAGTKLAEFLVQSRLV